MPKAMHHGLQFLKEPLLGLSGLKAEPGAHALDFPDCSRVLSSPPWHHTCMAQRQKHSPGSGRLGGQCLQGAWRAVGHRASCQVLAANPAL